MATSSASSLLSVVQHYQRSIENSQDDEKRLLHCISKLYKLPIKVEHLQETGIGKTVNSLRRFDGEIGVAAQALVTKWKAMVAADEEPMQVSNCRSSDEEEPNNGNGGGSGGNSDADQYDDNRNNARSESKEHKREEKMHKDRHHHSSSRSNNTKENKDKHSKTREDDSNNSNKKHSSHHQQHEKSDSSSSSKHKSSSSSHNNEKPSTDDVVEKLHKSREKKSDKTDHHNKEREQKESSRSEKNIVTPTASSSHHKSSSKHREERSSAEITEPKQSREKSEHTREKDKHFSSKNKDSDMDKNKDKDKREHHSKSSSVSHSKQKQDNVKSGSKEKDKHNKKDSKHSTSSADASAATPPSTSSSAERKRRHNNENDDTTQQENNSAKKIKTQKESKNQTAESPEGIDEDGNGEADDGIDSSMGANFADVLGMLNIPTKKSKKSLNTLKSPSVSGSGSGASSSKHSNSVPTLSATPSKESSNKSSKRDHAKPSTSTSPLETKPDLLSASVKLQPLDPSIVLALPAISNNYKPMPLNQTVMDCVFNTACSSSSKASVRTLTDAEALSHGISSKTMRTKIYSGARTGQIFQVPSLFDLCIRILQKNIDALEYTGGVPFEVLRSVLDRASPQQLLVFEEYNPYVIGDSDVLWQQHCQRNYRTQRRQEMESWREMYLRCQEDQERKLSILAENIKKSQKESEAPIRKTQLAFVDSMVKPPRNVQRKQEQFGTKSKLIATPAARVAALSSVTPNAAKTGDTRLRIAAATRDAAQVSHAIARPKKAPLMAKTLQFMRGRNKR